MTNLTSVSTFGWFTEDQDSLLPVATFGWFLDVVVDPDIFLITLNVSLEAAYLVKIGLLYNSEFDCNITREKLIWTLPERD